ncbi:MAG: DUF4190 domain-containing protein [Tepidisphaerales bacterium]
MSEDHPQDGQQPERSDAANVVPLSYESRVSTGENYRQVAIAALICGILLPPIGFILGRMALNGMKKSGNRNGRGMALVGYILGLISIIVLVLCALVFVVCMIIINTH